MQILNTPGNIEPAIRNTVILIEETKIIFCSYSLTALWKKNIKSPEVCFEQLQIQKNQLRDKKSVGNISQFETNKRKEKL